MFYDPEVIDYSAPYKTFNELCDGDTIFLIDYKKLEVIEYSISDFKKKKVTDDYYKKNCFEVRFKIPLASKLYDVYESITIYDGNTFLYSSIYKNSPIYFATDKRIAETILEMFKSRNNYQWDMFSEIFGNPLEGKYESRHTRLR